MNFGVSKIIWVGVMTLGAVVILSGALLFFGRTESEISNPQPFNGANPSEGEEFPKSSARESSPYQYVKPIPKDAGPNPQNTITVKEQPISSQSSEKLIFPQDYEPEAGNDEESYNPSQDSEEEGE